MATAPRDGNYVPTLTAALNTDGQTVIDILASPTTHKLKVNEGNSGSDFGPVNALRDGNDVPTLLATSSGDGRTIVVCYSDSNGNLLIDSN